MSTHFISQGFPMALKLADGTSQPVVGWEVFEYGGQRTVRPITLDRVEQPVGSEFQILNQPVYVVGGVV